MANKLFGLGAGAIVLYALFSGGDRAAKQEAKYEATAAKEWNLSEQQIPILRDCKASLSRHEKRFSEQIPQLSACACVAQRIGRQVQPSSYQDVSNVLDILIEVSTEKDRKERLFNSLKHDKSLEGLPFKQRLQHMSTAQKAVRYCNALEKHIDNPEKLKLLQEARARRRLRQQK